MSFVANQPSPGPAKILNDGWYPDIDVASARAAMRRVDGTVTPERFERAIITAIIEVGRDLGRWKAARMADGYATLAAVPCDAVGGQPIHQQNYLRAVYSTAHADLLERMPDYDLTAAGQRSTEPGEVTADALRRDASWAITAILGRPRTTVELI